METGQSGDGGRLGQCPRGATRGVPSCPCGCACRQAPPWTARTRWASAGLCIG